MEAIFNFLMKNPGGMMVLQWLFVIMGAIIVFFIRKYFKDRDEKLKEVEESEGDFVCYEDCEQHKAIVNKNMADMAQQIDQGFSLFNGNLKAAIKQLNETTEKYEQKRYENDVKIFERLNDLDKDVAFLKGRAKE